MRSRCRAESESGAITKSKSYLANCTRRAGRVNSSNQRTLGTGLDGLFNSVLNGVRTGEMAKIQKRDIDWQSRKVRIEQGKTGNVKVIGPLAGKAMEILDECCATSNTEHVFFRGKNIPPKFYKTLARACERAGVLYGKNKPGGLVLYDSRHTATTHMLESGVSPATVKEWMGWADSSFVLYYSHATEKSREKAGRSMERLAGKKIA